MKLYLNTRIYFIFRYVLDARDVFPMGDMISHLNYLDMYIGIVVSEEESNRFIKKMNEMYPGININDVN